MWARPPKGALLKDWPSGWFWFVVFCTSMFSFNGGWVNSIAFLGAWKTGLTHLTGLTTNGAIRVINPAKPGQIPEVVFITYIMGFYCGATLAGFIIAVPRTHWGRSQGLVLLINSAMLFGGWFLAESWTVLAGFLITFAMGGQNAITTLFAPMALRNTHVTGHVLDLGIATGQTLRNLDQKNVFKIQINLPTYTSFWAGALCGTMVFNHLLHDALLISSIASFVVGAGTVAGVTLYNIYTEGLPDPAAANVIQMDPIDDEEKKSLVKS